MRIGVGPGPSGAAQHQSTHYVYDARSGDIVGVHHFLGAAPDSDADRVASLLRAAHQASGVPLEHLAVLTNPDMPTGDGALRVAPQNGQLVREGAADKLRLRP